MSAGLLRRVGRPCAVAFAMAALLAPAQGLAQVDTLPFPPPPPSSTQILSGHLVGGLLGTPPSPGIISAAYGIDVALDPADATASVAAGPFLDHLADSVEAALVRADVRAARQRPVVSAGGAPRRSASRGQQQLFRLSLVVSLAQGRATVRGKLTRLPMTIWDALRAPDGHTVAAAFAVAPIDLEIRALAGLSERAVRLDALRIVPIASRSLRGLLEAPILDVAILDMDGDLRDDVIVLQPRSVWVVSWSVGGLSRLIARHELGDLPLNSNVIRAPMGRLVRVTRPDGRPLVLAASSALAAPVGLQWGARDGALRRVPLAAKGWPLYSLGPDRWLSAPWPTQGTDLLAGEVMEVGPAGPVRPVASLGEASRARSGGIYDLRAHGTRTAASPSWDPVLVSAGPGGQLSWRAASGPKVPQNLTRRGGVSVAADLDGDGVTELLTTSARLSGHDTLSLYRLGAGTARRLWSGRIASPVTAAAVGDVDGDGFREFVVATWDREPSAGGHRGAGAGGLTIVVPRDRP